MFLHIFNDPNLKYYFIVFAQSFEKVIQFGINCVLQKKSVQKVIKLRLILIIFHRLLGFCILKIQFYCAY